MVLEIFEIPVIFDMSSDTLAHLIIAVPHT